MSILSNKPLIARDSEIALGMDFDNQMVDEQDVYKSLQRNPQNRFKKNFAAHNGRYNESISFGEKIGDSNIKMDIYTKKFIEEEELQPVSLSNENQNSIKNRNIYTNSINMDDSIENIPIILEDNVNENEVVKNKSIRSMSPISSEDDRQIREKSFG